MAIRIEVAVEGGVADGVAYLPEGPGPFPLVVSYMDAGGLRPALASMAERLVAAGYAVVQPNLYWRSGPFAPFDFATVWTDPPERQRIAALMNGFTPAQAMSDTRAFIAAMEADARVDARRVGCVGYCMGGRMAFFAAAELADRVVASASIHGGALVTDKPNSPHLGAARMRGRLYFACADRDGSCTPEQRDTLGKALREAGVDHRIELFEGALHGFAVPDFPVYDEAAAERQWERVLELFAARLRA
ncbi:MAG: dienelactone hydrolase family protein [Myxococcota bacterium]